MMNWLYDLPIKGKFCLMFSFVVIGMAALCGLAYVDLRAAMNNQDEMYSSGVMPVSDIKELRLCYRGIQASLGLLFSTDNSATEKAAWEDIDKRVKLAGEILTRLKERGVSAEDREFLRRIDEQSALYGKARTEVFELLRAGKKREAYRLFETSTLPVLNDLQATLRDYGKFIETSVSQIDSRADQQMRRSLWLFVGLAVVTLAVLLVFCLIVARNISRAVAANSAVIDRMAAGDFSVSIPEKFRRYRDELASMGRSLQKMRDNISHLLGTVTNNAQQVAAASQQLTASSEQSAQSGGQAARSVEQIVGASRRQSRNIGETSSIVEQISAAVEEIAATANNIASDSGRMVRDADEGGKAAEVAIRQMNSIQTAVDNLSGVINKLGEQSQAIGQIVNTIATIAAQTNLLALNAAIEAARAGEQGRGFAVVAEEVRKLAEQSQEAAKQIAGLIVDVQRDTETAVEAMRQGANEVRTGTDVVSAAAGRFSAIATAVAGINLQLKEVSSAIDDMASNSQRMVYSIKDIEGGSEEVARQAQEVSAAVEEVSAAMQEIASSSRSLAGVASELREVVGRFSL
ncbi:MAG: methyl-accepting chemotaxis protein [Negativicutes bacterium]|nr:methyl-accepting chemotaxis protein [Negativicutes bacterium]